jgi:hypothetical protein
MMSARVAGFKVQRSLREPAASTLRVTCGGYNEVLKARLTHGIADGHSLFNEATPCPEVKPDMGMYY